MSRDLIDYVRKSSPFRGSARTIHYLLADRANAEGVCWPKQETIAAEAGCSVQYVRRVLCEMTKSGHLEVSKRRTRGGNWNQYRVCRTETVVSVQTETPVSVQTETVVSLPIRRTTGEATSEPQKPSSPAAMEGEIKEENVPTYGSLTPAVDPFEPKRKEPGGPPRPNSQRKCLAYWRTQAVKAGHKEWNEAALRKFIRLAREKHGYTYDEVEILMARFFIGHDIEVRAFKGNLAYKFQSMLPALMKESQEKIKNLRSGHDSAARGTAISNALVEQYRNLSRMRSA